MTFEITSVVCYMIFCVLRYLLFPVLSSEMPDSFAEKIFTALFYLLFILLFIVISAGSYTLMFYRQPTRRTAFVQMCCTVCPADHLFFQ